MRNQLIMSAVLLASAPAWAATFSNASMYGPNFAVLGDQIDYHIYVRAYATPASSLSVTDPLPTGLDYVAGSLVCWVPSGSCTYDAPTRTVSYSGALAPGETADIFFSVTTTGVPGPIYITNQTTIQDPAYTTVVASRTTCIHDQIHWPLFDPVIHLAENDMDWYSITGWGVDWNQEAGTFLTAWIANDINTGQYYVHARTVDPSGARGEVRQVNHLTWGEVVGGPTLACSSFSGNCLVAWTETEPIGWLDGVRARRVDATGSPLADEIVLVQGGGYHNMPAVVHNPVRDEYLVVFHSDRDTGVVDVSAYRVSAAGVVVGSTVVASSAGIDRTYVMAAHLAGRDQYLITYTCEDPADYLEIRAKIAPGDLAGVAGAPEIGIATNTGLDEISAVGAQGDEYLVAWRRLSASTASVQVRARRVSGDGVPQGSADGFPVSNFLDNASTVTAAVDHAGDQGFLVGWEHLDNSSPTGSDQHGRYVVPGTDAASFLEFPTHDAGGGEQGGRFACRDNGQCLVLADVQNGVDARLVTSWTVQVEGFEGGTIDGWDDVVGWVP